MLNVNTYPPTPDSEVFSTPPTSPMPPFTQGSSNLVDAAGSVDPGSSTSTRRGGRPQNLLLNHSKTASGTGNRDIQHVKASPLVNQFSMSIPDITEQTVIKPSPSQTSMSINEQALKSPCFVHSQLEKGASLTDWLRHTQLNDRISGTNLKSGGSSISEFDSPMTAVNDEEDDEQFSRSLTRQLAETAVGVREMSKALGRARVHSDINSILVVTKARDNRLVKLTRELAIYLMQKKRGTHNRRLIVYVDAQLQYSKRFDVEGMKQEHPAFFAPLPKRRSSNSSMVSGQSTNGNGGETGDEGQLRFWTSDMCSRAPHLFDFVVTLGGDGTVLFTSWLFQQIVPPVLPFALGSLGFLTNFDFNDHKAVMDAAIDSGIRVNLRMRFTCTVYRAIAPEHCTKKRKAVKKAETGEILMKDIEKGGWEALESGFTGTGTHGKKDKEIMCFTTRPVESFEILNDLVVDRGPSPYVSLLELFGDEHHMTTVQADGLVVATPTGSTAYSLSAGGSLVHPEIPALLISPICPHTLSFRPMLLPDTMELRICVPYNSRSTAWASFDGRGRVELKQGDHIKVTASKYPFPTVCADKQSTDWFHAISRTLKWNERERQKSFVMVEESPVKTSSSRRATTGPGVDAANKLSPLEKHEEEKEDGSEHSDEDEDEDEDEEEEKFDIDDSSTTTSNPAASTNQSNVPSRSGSGTTTPARIRVEKADLSMTNIIPVNAPDSPVVHTQHQDQDRRQGQGQGQGQATTGESSDINHHDDGDRDNIHSPKSLLHGSKSKIPKDRDVEPMLTPRALDHDQTPSRSPQASQAQTQVQHHHQHPLQHQHQHQHHQHHHPHRIQLANVINPLQQARFALASGRPRGHGHRPSKSDDFGNRAFAVWGQDESDSNTDSG